MKLPKSRTSRIRNHQIALITDREQEPIRNLVAEATGSTTLKVAHVTPPELLAQPIDQEEEEILDERPEVGNQDALGCQEVLDECCDTEHLTGQCQCISRNVLHSTATEHTLAQPGTEEAFLGNMIGFKDGISVTEHPNSSGIKCTRKTPSGI